MTADLKAQHAPTPCYQVGGIEHRYSNRNHSDLFRCSVCGNARRFSLTRLGALRIPICDGLAIATGPVLAWDEYRELKKAAEAAGRAARAAERGGNEPGESGGAA